MLRRVRPPVAAWGTGEVVEPGGAADLARRKRGESWVRTYNVIDADGHVLEPVDLWDTSFADAYLSTVES